VGTPRSALAAWELVGKEEQHHSNLRLKLAQRLYERTPIWKQYLGGSLEVHAHVMFRGLALCANFTAKTPFGDGSKCRHSEVDVYRGKFPVFVGIREIAEGARPFASFVRLKLANDCHVFFTDAFEVARPPSREALLRVLNEELSSALRYPRIALGHHVDQVIERRAEVVDGLSGEHPDSQPKRIDDPWGGLPLLAFRILVGENAVCARADETANERVEIRQVFACPFSTQEGALEFVHGVTSP